MKPSVGRIVHLYTGFYENGGDMVARAAIITEVCDPVGDQQYVSVSAFEPSGIGSQGHYAVPLKSLEGDTEPGVVPQSGIMPWCEWPPRV